MKFKKVKNPRWANEEKTMISLEVLVDSKEEHFKKFIPVVVSGDDIEDHIKFLWDEASKGNYGKIKPFLVDEDAKRAEIDSLVSELFAENQGIISALEYGIQMGLTDNQDLVELDARKKYAFELSRVSKQEGYPLNVSIPDLTI